MPTLTQSQKLAIKAVIDGDPELSVIPNTPDGNFAIAEALNQPEDPTFFIWRDTVPTESSQDETGFIEAIDYSEWDTMDATKREAVMHLLLRNGVYRPKRVGARLDLQHVFSGQTTTIDAILDIASRSATRAEAAVAVDGSAPAGGDGSTNRKVATLPFDGGLTLSYQQVGDIRNTSA